MKPVLRTNGTVASHCPDCESIANFEHKGTIITNHRHNFDGGVYSRVLHLLMQCSGCERGGLARIHDNGQMAGAVLESFYPYPQDAAPLPGKVPTDIEAEFREAELCYSVGANRAASALFRSTVEKTLKANGYEDLAASGFDRMRLQAKIDKATEDGVITEALRNRAHDEIRVLGNDVLHDDWIKVEDEDVQAAHHYTQRILEAFYDHRASVKKILIDKGRISDPTNPATTT